MATPCCLSSFSAYIPIKHYVFHRFQSLRLHEPLLELQTRRSPSSFPDKSLVFASSAKKPRVRKKVKSNAELCNDIREFISMVGLPQGHVPSVKELSQHGRQDLANIVRRRGYKLIKEILMNTPNVESNMAVSSYENRNGTDLYEIESTGLYEKVNELAEGVPLLEGQDEDENYVPALKSAIQSWGSGESSTGSLLQEKAANFVQNGELDTMESAIGLYRKHDILGSIRGSQLTTLYGKHDVSVEDMELLTESQMGHGILSKSTTDEGKTCNMENKMDVQSTASIEESSTKKDTGSSVTSVSNQSTLKSKQATPPTAETDLHGSDLLPTEGLKDTGLDVEACQSENEVEINGLKGSLHRKELELAQLKEQIEKEQGALSILQTKAETEMNKAQNLISAKDVELQAAEESLSGLKEVQVEYWTNGDNVEVAGSFNGWDHRIKMDLHISSSAINSLESRKCRLWSTVLWLYPGVYEIKFIVDGHWMIDPKRETITRSNIQNNILKVDN
ncbi:protein PTST homolog 3, chloroplastic isoform X2 [Macadamia integrifolia]|uniref:protein PTST homolog 3, chloroplastic isoform X2 n=1 Tax=Macadamia integrifolia TaxID=60698 RepID=UPI001C4FC045|nr:protein PTST homolog 3, chloroplastic isoform X2 [Macadamia integrifolia]